MIISQAPVNPLAIKKNTLLQLDRQIVQLVEAYDQPGHPIYAVLHTNDVLTEVDKGVVAEAIAAIEDKLNTYNSLKVPDIYLKRKHDGSITRLDKTREALNIVLHRSNWAHLPKSVLLVIFQMMATDGMVYDLFGKRAQYTLALVCKAWCESALECPAMWSNIRIRTYTPEAPTTKPFRFSAKLFKAFEEVVGRSKKHELRLSLDIKEIAVDRTQVTTNDPGQTYWAKKHVFLLVKQASRWAAVKMSCEPSLMACLCVLRPPVLGNLRQLCLRLKPVPGVVYTKVYAVQELLRALERERCIVVLQGFEVLCPEGRLITDEKRQFLTVQDGAPLHPFELPSLRAVTITSKLSSTTAGLIADNTFHSVSLLFARSNCTAKITMLTLTNAVFSETLLDLVHSLANLMELQVRAIRRGAEELKLLDLRTMLKDGKLVKRYTLVEREQVLPKLVRLVFAIDVEQKHEPGYNIFFSAVFNEMLKERSAKKLNLLQLSPSTRRLVADKRWQEMLYMKGISIRLQDM